ncbi:MAG: PorV/PorQ family protein [Caldithrix sp.]|nr:PorV/PorQ family protein [Caldithrix sp.]
MKKIIILLSLTSFFIGLLPECSLAINRDKRAQAGMKFLQVSLDARASALSSAITSMELNSSALMYNPAAMSRMEPFGHVSLGQMQWIADINYFYGTAAFKPMGGQWGVVGLSAMAIDYGDLQGTILANNEQGFLDTRKFSPTAMTFGVGYAKALTNKFSIGGQVKYVQQNLNGGVENFSNGEVQQTRELAADVMAFDFGILYRTGFKSLNFGMNIRNFSQEIEYIEESFQLPLTFKMGISMDVMDLTAYNSKRHSLITSVDASHPRDFEEQVSMGLEYVFMQMFALRMGYTAPTDEEGMSFGAGFRPSLDNLGLNVDYAYTPFGILEDVHRFTFQFSF